MARHTTLSAKQRRDRLKKINEATVEKRNALYASDPEYREFIKGASRASYRKHAGMELRNLRNASDFFDQLPVLGSHRLIRGADTKRPRLTFSLREMATALGGYHPNVLRQWCREEKFPRPTMQAFCRGRELVYSLDQARALMKIMGEHQQEKAYLSADDKAVIAALFAVMAE